jgi:hypothetical protein
MKRAITPTLALLCGILLASASWATTRRVGSGELYHTITAAHAAAANGDTILVAADTYTENVTLTKQVTILGAGFSSAGASRINGLVSFNAGSGGSTLEGFFVVNDTPAISLGNATNITLRRVRAEATYSFTSSVISRSTSSNGRLTVSECFLRMTNDYNASTYLNMNGDSLYVTNTIFGSSTRLTGFGGTASSLVVENCCFLNPFRVFNTTGWFPMLIANNIFYDWHASAPGFGTYPTLGTWEYNASTAAFPAPGVAPVALTVNPFVTYVEADNFVYGTSNLHLHPVNGAPCIDAGQPAQTDVLDGSPCDLGIYGSRHPFIDSGAPNYPFVVSLTVPGAIVAGQPLPISATGRIGREE